MTTINNNIFQRLILLFIIGLSLTSCFEDTEKYEMLSGEWGCVSWINEQRNIDLCDEDIYFNFQRDKTYNSILGDERDTGRYKIIDQMLYVSPDGKQEFSVRIQELHMDTTVFIMNSAGEQEVLTLYKLKR